MIPAAPPSFATMKACLKADCSRSAVMRASVSLMPPAAKGTTSVTGRSGQAACAGVANSAAATARADFIARHMPGSVLRRLGQRHDVLHRALPTAFGHVEDDAL